MTAQQSWFNRSILGVLLATAVGGCGSSTGTTELAVLPGDARMTGPISVASFNAHILPAPGVKDRALRAGLLGSRFNTFMIVGISEVFGGGFNQDTIKEEAVRSFRQAGFFVATEEVGVESVRLLDSGLILASRYPIHRAMLVRFDRCFQLDCFASKGALLAKLHLPNGSQLNVVLAHLQSFEFNGSRMDQVRSLTQAIGSYFDSTTPLLIMGDFNIRGGPKAVRRTSSQYNRLLNALGEPLDTVGAIAGFDIPTNGSKRIDFVFCRNCSDLGEIEFAGTMALVFGPSSGQEKFSDHRAVTVFFEERP